MLRFVLFYEKYKFWLIAVFLLLALICLILSGKVAVNYDMVKYLPDGSSTKQAIAALEEDFDYPGMVRVMVKDVMPLEAAAYKKEVDAVTGVASVVWLDDYVDVTTPIEVLETEAPAYLDEYYLDHNALFLVEFSENDYSKVTGTAINEIKDILGDKGVVTGTAEETRQVQETMKTEVARILLIVVPVCILILMLAGLCWIEPVLYLISIGVAIAVNMGTNLIFGEISFITSSMTVVLQLAISIDYSIFLFHRFLEEKDKGKDIHEALAIAIRKSFTAISSSASTTIAGFLALLFMSYSIGTDLGLVLAKGIVLSFLTTLFFLPLLILTFPKAIDRTRHKSYLPKLKGEWTVRGKTVVVVIAVLITIPCFFGQRQNDFLYGDTSGSASLSSLSSAKEEIDDVFGPSQPVMILVPNDDITEEAALCDALEELPYVRVTQGLTTITDAMIPEEYLPQSVLDEFASERYHRIIVFLRLEGENALTYSSTADLEKLAQTYFPDQWLMAGKSTSITDIKSTVEFDKTKVNFFSILAVGIIILLAFRSLSLPVLLITVIESSIWINMSVPYFAGESLIYIGYLVVSSILLGATIDYAILMTNRYLEFRETHEKREAAKLAVENAGSAVITSALVLTFAGLTEGIVSSIDSISQIGLLLGRGAFLSGVMVIFVLPRLLLICDKIILKTTIKSKKQRDDHLEIEEGRIKS